MVQLDIDPTEFDSNQKIDAPLPGDLGPPVLDKLVPALVNIGYKADKAWIDAIVAIQIKTMLSLHKRLAARKTDPKSGYYGALLPIQEYFEKHPDTHSVSEGSQYARILVGTSIAMKRCHAIDWILGTWGGMGVGLIMQDRDCR